MDNKIKSKSAFTLAEVLITLVIIGIVAALTVSAVINTYVERSTISKVKKGLSILGQSKKLAEAQNGSIMGWNFGGAVTAENASQFWNYLKPYISVAKDCGTATDCYRVDDEYQLNGIRHGQNHSADSRYYKFVLADGGVMFFRMNWSGTKCDAAADLSVENVCAMFFYDVNGNKKPNTFGKDIFIYGMSIDGVYPAMDDDCNKNSHGFGCASYIIKNDNMNYLH